MPNSSPLIQLIEVLERVKTTAAHHYAIVSHNEADTRQAIINPILQALGWDLTNLNQVRVEITEAGNRIDYGLLDRAGCMKVIVEAKKVGTNLQQMSIVISVAAYAVAHGIPNVFLTDGLGWNHYTNFQPGQMLAEEIDIRNQSLVECAQFLVKHLDVANFWYQQPKAVVPTVALQPVPVNLPAEVVVNQQPQGQFLSIRNVPNDVTGRRLLAIRLPNGEIRTSNAWASALKEFVLYVLQKVHNISVPLLDQAGGNVHLLRLVEPPHDRNYFVTQYNGQQIYIYLTFSATSCVKNIKYILSMLPPNEDSGQAAIMFAD